jgi:hypothetical protein
VAAGTGHTFEPAHNHRWLEVTRPILEALVHARYFLEMAVRYGRALEAPAARTDRSSYSSRIAAHPLG